MSVHQRLQKRVLAKAAAVESVPLSDEAKAVAASEAFSALQLQAVRTAAAISGAKAQSVRDVSHFPHVSSATLTNFRHGEQSHQDAGMADVVTDRRLFCRDRVGAPLDVMNPKFDPPPIPVPQDFDPLAEGVSAMMYPQGMAMGADAVRGAAFAYFYPVSEWSPADALTPHGPDALQFLLPCGLSPSYPPMSVHPDLIKPHVSALMQASGTEAVALQILRIGEIRGWCQRNAESFTLVSNCLAGMLEAFAWLACQLHRFCVKWDRVVVILLSRFDQLPRLYGVAHAWAIARYEYNRAVCHQLVMAGTTNGEFQRFAKDIEGGEQSQWVRWETPLQRAWELSAAKAKRDALRPKQSDALRAFLEYREHKDHVPAERIRLYNEMSEADQAASRTAVYIPQRTSQLEDETTWPTSNLSLRRLLQGCGVVAAAQAEVPRPPPNSNEWSFEEELP